MPTSDRNICCLPAQKTLLAGNGTEGFCCCYKKAKKRTPEKRPVLLGYNHSSMSFKRREPKSFLNSWPFSPRPEGYVKVTQSCPTLVTSWTIQSMEFSRPEYWSGQPFPSPGDLPNPGMEPRSPTLQADSLAAEPQGKPKNTEVGRLSLLQGIFPTQESNWGLLHCRWILYQLSYQGALSPKRCNSSQLELNSQSLVQVNIYRYWLKTWNHRREVSIGSSLDKNLQLPVTRPCQARRTWELRNPEEKLALNSNSTTNPP